MGTLVEFVVVVVEVNYLEEVLGLIWGLVKWQVEVFVIKFDSQSLIFKIQV